MDRVLSILVAVASLVAVSYGQDPIAHLSFETTNTILEVEEDGREKITCKMWHHGHQNSELWFVVNGVILRPGPHIEPYLCQSQEGLDCTAAELSVKKDLISDGSKVNCVYRDETNGKIIAESELATIKYVSGHMPDQSNDSNVTSGDCDNPTSVTAEASGTEEEHAKLVLVLLSASTIAGLIAVTEFLLLVVCCVMCLRRKHSAKDPELGMCGQRRQTAESTGTSSEDASVTSETDFQ